MRGKVGHDFRQSIRGHFVKRHNLHEASSIIKGLTRGGPENPASYCGIIRPNPGLIRGRGNGESRIHGPLLEPAPASRKEKKLFEQMRT